MMLTYLLAFIKQRAKAFIAPFSVGMLTAFFAGLAAAGFVVPESVKAMITMLITGFLVSNTANTPIPFYRSSMTGVPSAPINSMANLKELFLQLLMSILAYFGISRIL